MRIIYLLYSRTGIGPIEFFGTNNGIGRACGPSPLGSDEDAELTDRLPALTPSEEVQCVLTAVRSRDYGGVSER